MAERLSHVEKAVIPGFYGSDSNGNVKTFSRGGSDITGSIVSKAVHASVYENWTDVSVVWSQILESLRMHSRSR